jgi:hypothetical protein
LTTKQRVLTSEVSWIKPIVDRMRRTEEPDRLAALMEKLNA